MPLPLSEVSVGDIESGWHPWEVLRTEAEPSSHFTLGTCEAAVRQDATERQGGSFCSYPRNYKHWGV